MSKRKPDSKESKQSLKSEYDPKAGLVTTEGYSKDGGFEIGVNHTKSPEEAEAAHRAVSMLMDRLGF